MGQAAEGQDVTGQQLGRYRLLTTLGQGGMGTIHLAAIDGLGDFRKLLVLKELRRDLASNSRFVHMFLREAKLAASLNHANVVQTVEASQIDDRYILAMEFLDGQPLSAVMTRAFDGRFPLQMMLHVLCEVLAGLHYAHNLRDYGGRAQPVIHRDICPQNIFVTYDGQVKVVDFGIAKAIDSECEEPRAFKGTMGYAAPEQIRGEPLGRGVDVFAVGVVLWEMITLRRFARGPATPEAIRARILGEEPRVSWLLPGVDIELAAICDRAMEVDPAERFGTAEEMRSALRAYLAGRGHSVDRTAMAAMMQGEFAAERAAMQELIEAGLRSRSGIAPKGHATPERVTGSDEITAVADLSDLVEDSRAANAITKAVSAASEEQVFVDPGSKAGRSGTPRAGKSQAAASDWHAPRLERPRMLGRRAAVGAGLAAAAVLIAYETLQPAEDGVTATPLQTGTATSPATEPDEPAGGGPAPSSHGVRVSSTAGPAAMRSPAFSGGAAPVRQAAAVEDRTDADKQPADSIRRDDASSRKAARRARPRKPRRAARRPNAPVREASTPTSDLGANATLTGSASDSDEAPAAGKRSVEMGMDLQAAPEGQQRIAFDNPFE